MLQDSKVLMEETDYQVLMGQKALWDHKDMMEKMENMVKMEAQVLMDKMVKKVPWDLLVTLVLMEKMVLMV